MPQENLFEVSMELVHDGFSQFKNIRTELNNFMINLNYSHRAGSRGQQVHHLYIALAHLDNVEKGIRISDANEEIIRLEKIYDKIRSLKKMILEYIKHLTTGV